jgi:hypothetical protein
MSGQRATPSDDATAEALMEWLDGFPAKRVERRLTELLARRRELDVEIRFLQTQLVRWRDYLAELRGEERPQVAPPQATSRTEQREYPTKRQAVLRLLSENPRRPWKLSEMRETLVKRGWLEDSGRAAHALQVTVLKMAKAGQIEKPEVGVYKGRG